MSTPTNVRPGEPSSPGGAPAAKKPRSPVERLLVWGGILLLLAVVAVEGRARKGYEWTLNALEQELAKDEGAVPQPLLVRDIDQHLVGWPKRTESEQGKFRTISLTWDGLLPRRTYGIDLTYDSSDVKDDEPAAVLNLVTHGAPEPEPLPVAESEPADAMGGPPMGGAGMMAGPPMHGAGEPGGGPGGGGFNPMDLDADGDGKISREEAQGQGRFADNFDRNDTNSDGYVDQDEIAALMERFRNRSAEGEGPGGRGRPESETPAETTAPDTAEPDSGATSDPAAGTEKPAESSEDAETTEAPPSSTPQ